MMRGSFTSMLTRGLAAIVLGTILLSAQPVLAGGLFLYEVGSADLGLAAAGQGARAQDASTVLTNPAGMTCLEGTQVLAGLQALYGDMPFGVDSRTSPSLGNVGGNPIGWFPGGGLFLTRRMSPKITVGLATTGNFGLAEQYDDSWAGRYYVQQAALVGVSVLPAVAYRFGNCVSVGAAVNVVYGVLQNRVAVNNITGPDGQLKLDDTDWGCGVNLGILYDTGNGTRAGLTYTSQVALGFEAPAEFSNLANGLATLLRARGLLDANVELGLRVPQTVMLSGYQRLSPSMALLGSAGWQQWSQFGRAEVGVESNDPRSLTTESTFDDTWHGALGLQRQVNETWRADLGVGYDSGFQQSGNISPALPANAAWRFGFGVKKQARPSFGWGLGIEYAYGGTLDVNKESAAPVALGGRGDLVGSFGQTGIVFLVGNLEWRF
jgi:long-chain fatty acid transport protein